MNKKMVMILLVILMLGAAIRLYHPTFRSLWGDEIDALFRTYNFAAHTYHYERINPMLTVKTSIIEPLKLFYPPLFSVCLGLWAWLFGVGEYSLRLLSILFAIASLPLVYLLARRIFDEGTAILSVFLVSISGMAIMFSQEVRTYSLLMLLSIISALFFWELISGKRNPLNIVAYIISTILLALSHAFGAVAIMAQVFYVVMGLVRNRKTNDFISIALIQGFIALCIAPLYIYIFFTGMKMLSSGMDLPYMVFPPYLRLFLLFFALSIGETVAPWNFWVVIPAGLAFGYLFLRLFRWWRGKGVFFLLSLCLFPIIFAVLFASFTLPKYLIIALPFYLILIGRSLVEIDYRSVRIFLVMVICAVQAVAIVNYFSLKEYHNSNRIEPWRKVCSMIKENYRKGDIIIASNYEIIYRELQYYLNTLPKSDHPVFVAHFRAMSEVNNANDGNYPIPAIDIDHLRSLKNKRLWLVTHIQDKRKLSATDLKELRVELEKGFKLVRTDNYVPYEETLVSKLPIKRHLPGESRIRVDLYVNRDIGVF
ncbi:hypothetical protein AMJ44_02340 [candidate division WOR-1 bacterium DG_54_3]|uniref:Glycosyltransferase RgtA/B/C/D-like domain-containing protein n=1 Tax=candidate division WOR-1 bacterium DG_54_3 TaxID=1703775 RepID=A0A0S7Y678_UNCSA|nr:MAG: hypothetical protein AMJ44_02340 [candidate division WOR-1 bacterium DG_54_3]